MKRLLHLPLRLLACPPLRPLACVPLRLLACAPLLALLLPAATSAQALKVLTAGAMKPLVAAVAPGFEAASGVRLDIHNGTAGALLKRIQAGEAFDVVLLTEAGGRALLAAGIAAKAEPLARVGIGMAVKHGAARPPLANVDDFKRAIVGARQLAYIDPQAGGSSGIYLQGLFQRLGLADTVAPKAVLVPGGLTALKLVSGEADLAVQQASELTIVEGADFVGMLPDEIQNFTTYAWALAKAGTPGGTTAAAGPAFVAALAKAVSAGTLKASGIDAPAAR